MIFAGNQDYDSNVFGDVTVYTLKDVNKYHLSRFIEAQNQSILASCGMTKDKLKAIAEEIVRMCNDSEAKKVRTDVGSLANLILYSIKYPVEQECALKVGCVLSFIEGEDPDKINSTYEQEKLKLARENPEAYTFFLSKGIANIPEYYEILSTSGGMDFSKRQETIMAMLPDSLRHMSW